MNGDRIREIERELTRLNARRAELELELAGLKTPPVETAAFPFLSVDSKVELFLRMFCCRESVYPRRWENRGKGTSGYSPACNNEWMKGVCGKPPNGRVRCSECPNQAFPRLDAAAVQAHLSGQEIVGTYAIREDDTCVFLACDFDGPSWAKDAFLYRKKAADLGVEPLVERSRSGVGAHVWIFFEQPIPARLARALGTLILSKCGETDDRIALDSFDRFFPNQDYLPKGGFGNLIALPFQRAATEHGNTLFVDESLEPLSDQWAVLATVRRTSLQDVNRALGSALVTRKESPDDDLSQATSGKILDRSPDVCGLLRVGTTIKIDLGALIAIPLAELPPKLITALQRLASFANPEFFKLQRMRRATYPHPRFIFSGEKRSDVILLPRGLLARVMALLERAGAKVEFADHRKCGAKQTFQFEGDLSPRQRSALVALMKSDSGVFVAPPGTGKTVVACALIGERKTSTLVLVHKQPLIDQWKKELVVGFGMDDKQIGVLGGTRRKRTRSVDIAMLQSLARAQDCAEILSEYGLVVIDECHHVPATSFEAVMKQCAAKHILGLTATPRRKDGLEVLLFQQCGPIRHEIKVGELPRTPSSVHVRETGLTMPDALGASPPYHQIAQVVATNDSRNRLIAADIVGALCNGRFPVVLADRKEQLGTLEKLVAETSDLSAKTFRLEGPLSPKARRQVLADVVRARGDGKPVALFATAALVGEGFNLPELDALFLASPISFEGRLIQYVGRLQRSAPGKSDVVVFDYVDSAIPLLAKMCRGRIKVYEKLGFDVVSPALFGLAEQSRLF